ncbi:MAG: hypothetical protein A3C93_03090 [Candidatus Lloydbacteria bacterium RIFCSPHIGHO2_02_FULL_54_17]|uniref:Riboflavin biosynthesis intermediates N-glycosidase n=1 Tax=Candidatus Lloydbacteria bacterium RIFCSPHIGHO2_02_FULL_54_17 TaxID=1798664 RepID=A0A1G2DAK2_9BACT|nr:MAG: hypothetical protein A2762_04960 [Candidatus Lloydbacteria bacterium RIFCSPHIGHO2_01_FULL_54_11]OGZ10654.1 MAG: hypothetical protein A3C93_03090 [Candidatus Lloydbacteria bacterium RIFCSPHIGHO2_02_FULL_54_17]OGZ13689.1 MAG: hypothetical protein A2948_03280 [Candidatus Lloydbacteria bacterium RIFCSPLOWO2_01_FULL_54_18]OGZ16122.1 MAG: hypothetical protein A3H76_01740 [Candidatus Lloydbacteria bacterium RIFCSPLOWO2_02_FULL_54_12]
MDIRANAPFPASALSNFEAYDFVFDGVPCAGMEGLMQALKIEDHALQKQVCLLTGKTAKKFGQDYNSTWKSVQTLWWKGRAYARESGAYQELVDRAFDALATNARFQEVLVSTGTETLTHSIGSHDPKETVLTEEEFCSRLTKLRSSLAQEAKG